MDRLTSIVSVLSEKRYWWESVCNTAQASGEDSASDTQGCRVLMSVMGVCLRSFFFTEERLSTSEPSGYI